LAGVVSNFIDTTIQFLRSRGLSDADVLAYLVEIEQKTNIIRDRSAFSSEEVLEQRRAKDRERKRAAKEANSSEIRGTSPPSYIEEPSLSKQVEEKRRKIKSRAREVPLPDEWTVTPERRARLQARGASDRLIDDSAEAMRSWAHSKGIIRASWDATHDGFVLRDLRSTGPPSAKGTNGGHSTGNGHAKTHNLNDAAAALHERLLAAELQDRALLADVRSGAIEGDAWLVPSK
jgi:hypothetical protein